LSRYELTLRGRNEYAVPIRGRQIGEIRQFPCHSTRGQAVGLGKNDIETYGRRAGIEQLFCQLRWQRARPRSLFMAAKAAFINAEDPGPPAQW